MAAIHGSKSENNIGRPPSRESFEIAIICALPLESTAVSNLFDEFFDDLDSDTHPYRSIDGDPNHYTTGRIDSHNVVIVLLPGMGKACAASAAAYLKSSYRNVRLALVVGICGGVPGPNKDGDEVLLGDVVISNSLVQYDLGRQYPGGVFLRKSSLQDNLGRPNKNIRSLLRSFETHRSRDKLERRTAHYLRELQATYLKRSKRNRRKYIYPGADMDELFEPTYRHRHRFSTCCTAESTCSKALDLPCEEAGCEDSHLVAREAIKDKQTLEEEDPSKAQEPAIHIGAVASGDTVMKSGEDRDRIGKDDNVVAFEMEGAGVWDEMPCIIIKGVCDYADSHKRKRWQDFAAATAASATKALLETLGTVDSEASLVSRQLEPALREYFRRQACAPRFSSNDQLMSIIYEWQCRMPTDIKFHSVVVVDARGGYLPFHIETVNCKDIFVEILRNRFKDLGVTKIDRGEWSLEDTNTGEILDLSQPWQTIIKRGQSLKMSMDFRRYSLQTTKCPICGFDNDGLPTDQVECNVCRLTFRRIEDTQEIDVEDTGPMTNSPSATSMEGPPTVETPKRQLPEEDISRYRHIHVIDTKFKIRKACGGDASTNRAILSMRHLDDPESLVEELARRWGLPKEDCMKVVVEYRTHLSALRAEFPDHGAASLVKFLDDLGGKIPSDTQLDSSQLKDIISSLKDVMVEYVGAMKAAAIQRTISNAPKSSEQGSRSSYGKKKFNRAIPVGNSSVRVSGPQSVVSASTSHTRRVIAFDDSDDNDNTGNVNKVTHDTPSRKVHSPR